MLVLGLLVGSAGTTAASLEAPAASHPYSLIATVLTGGGGAELYLALAGPTSKPDAFMKIQIKTFAVDGTHVTTVNLFGVDAPGGRATIPLGDLDAGQRVAVVALVKDRREHVLAAEAEVRLRPDLAVERVHLPRRVVRTQPFPVEVDVAEVDGQTGASAKLTLYDGVYRLDEAVVRIDPGERHTVKFVTQIAVPGAHVLHATVADASPAEWNTTNNSGTGVTDVALYDVDGAVVSQHRLATEVGLDVLRRGGNAFDAAVAVQFALNVVQPHTTGIGGGASIVARLPNGDVVGIDARETAPADTQRRQYAGRAPNRVTTSGFAVGVPGIPRAVDYMLDRWGTMPLAELLEGPIRLADDGFSVGRLLAEATRDDPRIPLFQPETRSIFLRADGSPLQQGDILRQPDLASTFRLLAERGASAVYTGEIGEAIVQAQRRHTILPPSSGAGKMTLADLAAYDVTVARALSRTYRGYGVYTIPPSSSGGVTVLQALGMLERFPLGGSGYEFGSTKAMHVTIEALRLALADAAMWVGDETVCLGGLLSRDYLDARSAFIAEDARIVTAHAGTPCASEPASAVADDAESGHTTHFGVADRWGNIVSFTTTLTDGFGTGITVPGYGFVLNDALANFNLNPPLNPVPGDPGVNDPGPNKRPKGNTAPVVLVHPNGVPVVATGTWGGAAIPSIVLQVVSNVVDHGMSVEDAVAAPRLFFGAANGAITWSDAFPEQSIGDLRGLGHALRATAEAPPFRGSTDSLTIDPWTFSLRGVTDPRSEPDASGGVLEPQLN